MDSKRPSRVEIHRSPVVTKTELQFLEGTQSCGITPRHYLIPLGAPRDDYLLACLLAIPLVCYLNIPSSFYYFPDPYLSDTTPPTTSPFIQSAEFPPTTTPPHDPPGE